MINNSTKNRFVILSVTFSLLFTLVTTALAQSCTAKSGDKITPVIELYTSEGCSSCPPADTWLSTLKDAQNQTPLVVEAFHVNYWDYIGWTDRFASPAYTARQRQISAWQNERGIYTPQIVRNGMDLQDWRRWQGNAETAIVSISLTQEKANIFAAEVTINSAHVLAWSAYWTVTEDGYSSRVQAGENSGEFLKHDFVVRQYQPAGDHVGTSRLILQTAMKDATHPRRVNLVIFNPQTGKPLQALSLAC